MFGRLSTKIRPGAAIASAVCLTLIVGGNTLAFADDAQLEPQPEVSAIQPASDAGAAASQLSHEVTSAVEDRQAAGGEATRENASPAEASPEADEQPAPASQEAPATTSRGTQDAAGNLVVSLEIAADGTESFNDDSNAGNDSSASNGILRVNDTVTYALHYSAASGSVENYTAKIVFPKGLSMAELPGVCRQPGSSLYPLNTSANVTFPLTKDSINQLEEQTLICNLGAVGTSTNRTQFVAKLSNLARQGEVFAPKKLAVSATNVAETDVQTVLPSVKASSRLMWDLSKNAMALEENTGYRYNPSLIPCPWDQNEGCFITLANPS